MKSIDELIAEAPDELPLAHNASPEAVMPIHQQNGSPSVNARDLHTFLEIGKRFTTWMEERIEQYEFAEGKDFLPILGESTGGRPNKEFLLTLEMAKELSMVERNEQGKLARKYFIECEKELKAAAVNPLAMLDDPETMRGLLLGYTEQVINLKAEVATLAPKAAGFERFANTEETYCITDAAKTLNVQPKRLFDFLESNRWIYRRHNEWIAMQEKLNARLMIHKILVYEGSASVHSVTQARLTDKGVARLSELLSLSN